MSRKKGLVLLLIIALYLYVRRSRAQQPIISRMNDAKRSYLQRMNRVRQYDSTNGIGTGDISLEEYMS